MISPRSVVRSQAVPDPYFIRCRPEPKVIRLQPHAPPRRLIQQYRQSQRPGLAFAQTPQKKLLCYAALQHRIEQENIAALQLRPRTKINFAPCVSAFIHVSHILAHEVANHCGVDLANQVCGKNKSAVKSNNHVYPPAFVRSRNFSSERCHPRANSRG